MRSIFDVRMERWLISNQHRLAYGRWRTRAFTHAHGEWREQRSKIFRNGVDENENPSRSDVRNPNSVT